MSLRYVLELTSSQIYPDTMYTRLSSSENCFSTSAVKVPGKLGSPWEYAMRTEDADTAFASLVHAVERTSEATMKIVDREGHYILAEFPSKVYHT